MRTIFVEKMVYEIALRTTVPILLLIGLGYSSRKIGLLKAGDERVLNAYIYYFALHSRFSRNQVYLGTC